MKNLNKIFTLLVYLLFHLSAFAQTTLVSPTNDINDGTDYCDPIFVSASNNVSTNGFDVELISEEDGFVALTDGFVATASASNFVLAAIVDICVVSTNEIDFFAEEINTYPNPFINQFTLELTLKSAATVDFKLYNQTGKLVTILINDTNLLAGKQAFSFSAADLPTGIYFYELQVNGHRQDGKLTCIR